MLANKLLLCTDNEKKMLGTVRMNNDNGINGPQLKRAIEEIKNIERKRWMLWQTYEKKKDKDEDLIVAEEKAGYVVF